MAVDNNPRLSSIFYIVSNIAKVGLEILFIQVFKWGMYGAALSTGAGYLVGMVVVLATILFVADVIGVMKRKVSKYGA